jgi:P-type Ca2+ transporter type 2C
MRGLTTAEACSLLNKFGPNALPEARPPSFISVFFRQFLSPLIYILVAAAAVSLFIGDVKDSFFIGVVLLINGVIGAVQEYSAGQAAAALREHDQPHALVIRDGAQQEIGARELVPGDFVLLEAGRRVPADMWLQEATDLRCDESLLTGESLPVKKLAQESPDSGDRARRSMVFAGSMATRGRGAGVVVATGLATEVGKIAEQLLKPSASQPPLMIRMERFSRMIAILVAVAVAILVVVGLVRQMDLTELFMMAVGLAVSAIPEGLPVAISVALAISMRRMAKVNVIVRKMPAVESLGSCTMIATDKTGTLTLNELTVTEICLPDGSILSYDAGKETDTYSFRGPKNHEGPSDLLMAALLRAAALPNEAEMTKEQSGLKGVGDTVDVALLMAAYRGGVPHEELRERYPLLTRIPYEPDLKYAASFHRHEEEDEKVRVFVKGAPETLIAMANRMDMGGEATPVDRELLLRQKDGLMEKGLRVLGFADGEIIAEPDHEYGHRHLENLVFLGLVGMQDPVRPEAPRAIQDCYSAGIEVAMVTGDAPGTASVIGRQAGLVFTPDQVVTGADVRRAEEEGQESLDRLTRRARIYARVEPIQKLAIVLSLARNGHFVAVTGDGVNDAPALKHAHVGVAMGKQGTDVAKESADIIITDDNFASIVRGILEGRVAYANIRKVIFMLVSTGAAEVALFLVTIPLGLPMPLLPVQLLWLNLVTNGIQDVALATEKPEGDELTYPPRRPDEPIFNEPMIKRIAYSALVMTTGGFALFYWLLHKGYGLEEARNLLLLLFVLFENFQTFNSRSEHHSMFRQGFLSNPFLVIGVIGTQALHIIAMHVPGLSDILRIAPVSLEAWIIVLLIATSLPAVMEFEKWRAERRTSGVTPTGAARERVVGVASRRWSIVVGAVGALAVVASVALYWIARPEEPARFALETVARGSVVRAVAASGVIAPTPPQSVGASVSGVIQALHCGQGDKVKAGQLCAEIDPRPYRAIVDREKAALTAAQDRARKHDAQLARAKAAFERNQDLANRRAVSKAALARSRVVFERAQDRIKRDEAEILRRQKALEAAENNLNSTKIVSPVDGTVTARSVEAGQKAGGAKEVPLFLIAPDRAPIGVDVTVAAKEIGEVKPGDKATITFDVAPGRVLDGKINQIRELPRGDEATPRHEILIDSQAPDLTIERGTKASVLIIVEQHDNVLRVPNRALRYTPNRVTGGDREGLEPAPEGWARLWVLRNGQPAPITVQLGLDDGVHTEVLSGALKAGDQLILGEEG